MARTEPRTTLHGRGAIVDERGVSGSEWARSDLPRAGRQRSSRVVIENVKPEIDCGRHAIKRVVGEEVVVEADVFTAGHDKVACALLYRVANEDEHGGGERSEAPLEHIGNDRWRGSFRVTELGRYGYTIEAWVDHFATWRAGFKKKVDAGVDVSVDLIIGAELVEHAACDAGDDVRKRLKRHCNVLRDEAQLMKNRIAAALSDELLGDVELATHRLHALRYAKELAVIVDPPLAKFSAWYEMFPRSAAKERGRHGTFRDVIERLPYIAGMGFDVLYLPPIHPIGRTHRKGRNNAVRCEPGDVGSPWAIGGEVHGGSGGGGHKAIHSELGTLDDFHALVRATSEHELSLALDVAFQCSPDHPYVREHPEWFRHRPDGTIQYAENPPKKYQDIYPLDFDTDAWESLWVELRSVFVYWIDQGVTVFRVDNPHTKPLSFWEWCISSLKREHPEVIFLSEAFTRPKVMYELAKIGFTQSYTYFTWRNARWELEEYFTELAQSPVREFFRPNVWPNTPDILHECLQQGGRPAFVIRYILAATLAANYGIYGPAFEMSEHAPRVPRSEEYLNSEKYEIRHWDWGDAPAELSLRHLIARLNAIRRENAALQGDWSLRFHACSNEEIICYSKVDLSAGNIIVTAVNLDPFHTQSGWVEVPLEEFGIAGDQPFVAHDLLTDVRYTWRGRWNYVELNPFVLPAHILRIESD